MNSLKRLPVKWIRDKAKSAYTKGPCCDICGSEEELDLHHFHGVTDLFNRWCKKNKLQIETDDDILAVRDDFIAQHHEELYVKVVTLCHSHHMKLHSIYGKAPTLATAAKQERWVNKQKDKYASS